MKASDNQFPSALFAEQANPPAAPAAGYTRLFFDINGVLKSIDSTGTVTVVTSQFPTGVMGSIFYQEADGSIASLPPGTDGQFLAISNTGLPAWVDAPSGGGGGGGTGTNVLLSYVSDGDANGLFYHLGSIQGAGTWVNPANTDVLTLTASGGQFQGNTGNIVCVTDRTTDSGTGEYDCVITGNDTTGEWILFDLGSTRSFTPIKFCYQHRGTYNSDGTNCYAAPAAMILEGSTDGNTFTTLATLTCPTPYTPSSWVDVAVTGSTLYRFLRVTKTVASSSETLFSIGEMEMYGTLNTTS